MPLEISATSLTSSTIELMWSAPITRNGIIRNYQITYFPTNNASDVSEEYTGGESFEFTITGLRAYTNYSVSIAAITITVGNAGMIVQLTNESSKSYLEFLNRLHLLHFTSDFYIMWWFKPSLFYLI